MKSWKKLVSLSLILALTVGTFAACGGGDEGGTSGDAQVYFLNFKPEIADAYKAVAAEYEAETGVKVKIETAASGTYETQLKSEMSKKNAPTIFQINGPQGYQNWKDYCLDLKDTTFYSYLTDPSLAIESEGGVYGIPYVVEGYGIIYNDEIMQKYFALPDKKVEIASTAEITNFDLLKAVVEDMTAHKADLGIQGVFASTSLAAGNQWRWQTHLANIPFYYEFSENTEFDDTILAGFSAKTVDFKYADNFKNLFDLYVNNSGTEKGLLGSKSVDDSMAEFALGQVAMVQNGNWAWNQIEGVDGNVVKAENIKFMPLYTGMPQDAQQGLCVGTENYLAINSQASEEQQKASLAFLEWLFGSDKGKAYVKDSLNLIAPFNTFEDSEKPEDPLAKEVLAWMEKDGVNTVPWTFACFPSEAFKDYFGNALLEYVQGSKTWDDVVTVVKDSWESERANSGAQQ